MEEVNRSSINKRGVNIEKKITAEKSFELRSLTRTVKPLSWVRTSIYIDQMIMVYLFCGEY